MSNWKYILRSVILVLFLFCIFHIIITSVRTYDSVPYLQLCRTLKSLLFTSFLFWFIYFLSLYISFFPVRTILIFFWRQMVVHGLINWNLEIEKKKNIQKRNEKKDEKRLLYYSNPEVINFKLINFLIIRQYSLWYVSPRVIFIFIYFFFFFCCFILRH